MNEIQKFQQEEVRQDLPAQQEIWKDIPGYRKYYQASNLGRIRSLPRMIKNTSKSSHLSKLRVLKAHPSTKGYLTVVLCKNSKTKSFGVHRLVACAFLGHKLNLGFSVVVDHINNINTDNRLENLQLVSVRTNTTKDKPVNSSGYLGVVKRETRYYAVIVIDGKSKKLGSYKTPLEAHKMYLKAVNALKNKEEVVFQKKVYTSKYKGISYAKHVNKWVAYHYYKKSQTLVGYFEHEEQAYQELLKYKNKISKKYNPKIIE
jgi:hypothetical protein